MELDRRKFLGFGAAAGAAALLTACGATSSPTASSAGAASSGGAAAGGSATGGSAAATGGATTKASGTVRPLFMKQAGYSEDDINGMLASFKTANPGITVDPTFVAYEALHDKIVISASSGTFDMILMDGEWIPEFAQKQMISDVTARFDPAWKTTMLPVQSTATYQDKLWGFPWVVGGKLFYYNKKILATNKIAESSMKTWDGVLAAAKTLKSSGALQYPFVWSWVQAEAIMCDYTTLLAAFGGKWTDDDGKLIFNTGGGVKALEWMKMTIDQGLTDPASTKYTEDDVKRVLLQGRAGMVLNWDYVYSGAQDPTVSKVVGDIVVTTSPAGPSGSGPACTGTSILGITSGSKNPDAAWELISFMGSEAQQDKYVSNITPVWAASYTKPEVLGKDPELAKAHGAQLKSLIERPQVNNYSAISQIIQGQLQLALLGSATPQAALDGAVSQANDLLN